MNVEFFSSSNIDFSFYVLKAALYRLVCFKIVPQSTYSWIDASWCLDTAWPSSWEWTLIWRCSWKYRPHRSVSTQQGCWNLETVQKWKRVHVIKIKLTSWTECSHLFPQEIQKDAGERLKEMKPYIVVEIVHKHIHSKPSAYTTAHVQPPPLTSCTLVSLKRRNWTWEHAWVGRTIRSNICSKNGIPLMSINRPDHRTVHYLEQ